MEEIQIWHLQCVNSKLWCGIWSVTKACQWTQIFTSIVTSDPYLDLQNGSCSSSGYEEFYYLEYNAESTDFLEICHLHLQGKKIRLCLLPLSHWFLAWLILQLWKWWWHVPLKCQLTSIRIQGIIPHFVQTVDIIH